MNNFDPRHEDELLPPSAFARHRLRAYLIVAIAAIISFIVYKLLPFAPNASKGLAFLLFIAILWLTEALHVTITALLVVVVGAFLGIDGVNLKSSLSSFANPIIYLFFGGFALASALHAQKLDLKISLKIISLSKGSFALAISLIFVATALLSMWISNTATAAMMLPLALGLLSPLDPKKHRATYIFVLLGVAYSASIGGIGTPIGSPPNAIAQNALGISFLDWLTFGIPLVIVILPILLFVMFLLLRPTLKVALQNSIKVEDIPWTKERILTIAVFVITALAWIFSKYISAFLGIKDMDALIAVTAAVVVVALNLVTWRDVQDNTDWGVLMLFGGGIALSNILKVSGASLILGQSVAQILQVAPLFLIILVSAAFIIFLTEFSSNTASAALLVPIFASISESLNIPPHILVLVIGVGVSCAFMLPVATPPNAIVYGTGYIKQREMIRVGVVLNIVSIGIITLWSYIFLT
ncbi:MAG: DASS family sodium-coupled anion symporter [Helicobacter sp.]|nr:DASS family sodium-coupled anion symporter [Helicobacter sp.]